MSSKNRRICSNTVDKQLGIQKFEDKFRFRMFIHQGKTSPGFGKFDLDSKYPGTLQISAPLCSISFYPSDQ